MTTNSTTLLELGEKAAYRTAGRKITKEASKALLKVIKSKGTEEGVIKVMSSVLDSELGEALIGGALGIALLNIPKINKDIRVQRIAEEFQIESSSVVIDLLIGELLGFITPILETTIKSLPEESSNLRVISCLDNNSEEEESYSEDFIFAAGNQI